MAVELTGAAIVFDDLSDGNTEPYTIPSDAEAVIVIANGCWAVSHAHDFDVLNWDAGGTVDFNSIVIENGTGNEGDLFAYIMTDTSGDWPGTGAQTLTWGVTSASTDGQSYIIQAVKGLNTTTPIRDTDQVRNHDNNTWTASLAGVVSGDATFICMAQYNPDVSSITHGDDQIIISDSRVFNTQITATSWEDGEGSPSITSNAASNFDASIAFALAQAVDDISHVAALAESFDNVVRRRAIKVTSY